MTQKVPQSMTEGGGSGAVDTPFPGDFAIRYDLSYRNCATPYAQSTAITFTRNTTGAIQGGEMVFSVIHDGTSAINLGGLLTDGNVPLGVDMTAISEAGRTYVISAFLDSGGYSYGARKGALVATGPTVPGAPTALTRGTATSSTQPLTWTAPASNGGSALTDYIVEYKASSSGTWLVFSDGTSTTASATVPGLSPSTSYDYRVKAVNAIGAGAYSSTATGSTAAASSGSLSKSNGTVPGSAIATATAGSNNWAFMDGGPSTVAISEAKLSPSLGAITVSSYSTPVVFGTGMSGFPGITTDGSDSTTGNVRGAYGTGVAVGGAPAGTPFGFIYTIPVTTAARTIDLYFFFTDNTVAISMTLADSSATTTNYVTTATGVCQRLTISCTAGSTTTLTLDISNSNTSGGGYMLAPCVMVQ
jgi:Fibronectin type III domain